ncbi:MAG: ABC transporter permease [Actinobacteria bacterium]|nr:ABC transporter permease [Actinomycetota bacterium]
MLTIASLTFKEALRKKILLAAVVLTLLFLVLYGTGLHFMANDLEEMREHQSNSRGGGFSAVETELMIEQSKRMFLLLGIYFSSSIVSLLAIFSSVGSVSAEIENGMLHAIMAKPIRRRDIILGKFIGYALMLSFYAAILFISILALNHYIAGAKVPREPGAVALFILQPLVLLAFTIAGSTRFSTLANGITAFMLYTIGVIGGMIEWVGVTMKNSVLSNTGIVTSLLMPVDSIYRMIVGLISDSSGNLMSLMGVDPLGPFGTASRPSIAMLIYTFIYLVAFIAIAVRSFSRRDIA